MTSSIKQLKSHRLLKDENNINDQSATNTNEQSVVRCLNMNMNKDVRNKIDEVNSDRK